MMMSSTTEVVDVYEKRKKHCRRLPVYAKRRGGGQEEERFFCMSVEVDGDAIFGVVREDGTRDNNDDDTNHHHHHHHHATTAGRGNSSSGKNMVWRLRRCMEETTGRRVFAFHGNVAEREFARR